MDQKNEACYAGLVHLLSSGTRKFIVYSATVCTFGYVLQIIIEAAGQVETTAVRVAIIAGCMPFLIVSVGAVWFGFRTILRLSDHDEGNNTDAESLP